jgi:hypothetical protein
MTRNKREAEAQRLMDLLTGTEHRLLTETGELVSTALNTEIDDDESEDLAPFWAACPLCGERRIDCLDLDTEDDDWTETTFCLTCGTVFALEYCNL